MIGPKASGKAEKIEYIAQQRTLNAAAPIFYGGVLSIGITYTLQVVAQRKAPPAHSAVMLNLERVFATLAYSCCSTSIYRRAG